MRVNFFNIHKQTFVVGRLEECLWGEKGCFGPHFIGHIQIYALKYCVSHYNESIVVTAKKFGINSMLVRCRNLLKYKHIKQIACFKLIFVDHFCVKNLLSIGQWQY